jgi:serine/threonine protein kinase
MPDAFRGGPQSHPAADPPEICCVELQQTGLSSAARSVDAGYRCLWTSSWFEPTLHWESWMTLSERCPSCGARVQADLPAGGVCPVCLFGLALEPSSEAGTSMPPSPDVGAAPPVRFTAHPLRIGPYRILTVLGQGGMGVVYLAEQDEPIRRKVALKVIKLGMDTREVFARFNVERQALALMSHLHIAQVFDGGASEEGRPYFVMEYVAGVPITEYCDRNRLSIRERLALFIPVCQAVQHAHQKGIIHRDLKPSNVLVAVEDGRAVPKIIDFGIAKAIDQRLSEETIFTRQGVLIGTPEYMSPEQADPGRAALDTTTDIYSLGVVLYELLVGVLPFDADRLRKAAYAEVLRIIRDEEPRRPSLRVTGLGVEAGDLAQRRDTDALSLRRQLQGDLDWILLKALEKDGARRYPSASEFAADIERHLADEPVTASRTSAIYQVRKFVRRHRVGVAAATAVLVALVAGLALSTLSFLLSERHRMEAEDQAYTATIAAADVLAGSGHQDLAAQQLLQAPRLGWEWWHLFLKTDTSLATLKAWGNFNRWPYRGSSFVFSPDGRRVYFNTETTLHEWDTEAFAVGPTRGGFGTIIALAPGARMIVTKPRPTTVPALTIVDPVSGRVQATLLGHTAWIQCAAVSADGRWVASGARDGTVRTWDIADME